MSQLWRIVLIVLLGLFTYALEGPVIKAAPISVHASVGRLIGKVVDSPPEAFALGVLSHVVMDYAPYHQVAVNWDRLPAFTDYLVVEFGGLMGVGWAIFHNKDPSEVAGVLGAIAPDVIDAMYGLVTGERYAKPLHRLFPSSVQSPTLNKVQSELYTVLIVAVTIRF